MGQKVLSLPLAIWSFILLREAEGSCQKPPLNTNSYTLSEEKTSYAINETYEIYCVPGYVTSDGSNLVCGNSGWSISAPQCTPAEGSYPWWLLLVAVLLFILLVSCILPRFLQCCLSKTRKKTKKDDTRDLEQNNDDYDDDDGVKRAESPVPNFTKHKKMSNIEFMTKLHEGADKKTLKRATKNSTF